MRRKIAVSATKSVTGHLLGAAGVVGHLHGACHPRPVAPPTMNLHQPGEGCDSDYVPMTARKMRIDTAMSNSFGFGGTNGTVVLRRFTADTEIPGAMRAPFLHVEPLQLSAGALLALAALDAARYPVLLDSAAEGSLSQVSLLAALPRGRLWLDAAGLLHTEGAVPPTRETGPQRARCAVARRIAAGRRGGIEPAFRGGWFAYGIRAGA
jgi:hypothetical protein